MPGHSAEDAHKGVGRRALIAKRDAPAVSRHPPLSAFITNPRRHGFLQANLAAWQGLSRAPQRSHAVPPMPIAPGSGRHARVDDHVKRHSATGRQRTPCWAAGPATVGGFAGCPRPSEQIAAGAAGLTSLQLQRSRALFRPAAYARVQRCQRKKYQGRAFVGLGIGFADIRIL